MTTRSRLVARSTKWSAVCAAVAFVLLGTPHAQETDIPGLTSHANRARVARVMDALSRELPYVPGELVVAFRDSATGADQQAALTAVRAGAGAQRGPHLGDAMLVTDLAVDDMEQAAWVLRQQPDVVHAEPNYIYAMHSVPSDAQFSRQWNLDQIRMPAAWDVSRNRGEGVTVAVIDSGFTQFDGTLNMRLPVPPAGTTFTVFPVPFARPGDFDHARVRQGEEFTPTGPWSLSDGRPLLFDAVGHGSHVAATIAQQTDNAFGFAGVANRASLLPLKACFGVTDLVIDWGATGVRPPTLAEGCDTVGVAGALYYAADNGAKVVNMSLGGPGASTVLRQALDYAVSRGVFVAVSAGNSALNGNPTNYPAGFATSIEGVVSVGATTPSRERAGYSSTGSYVELVAPGGQGPAGCGGTGADQIWQIAPSRADLNALPPRFDRYVEVPSCGTSMAAPHVTGAAALLYSQGITKPAAIEAALERFAQDLGAPGKDNDFGYGLIDVRAALRGLGLAR